MNELIDILIANYKQELSIALPTIFTAVMAWVRGYRPKFLFSVTIAVIDKLFQTQIKELIAVSQDAILKRIKSQTYASRVALIDFKRNGYTSIEVLCEVKNSDTKSLMELNNSEAHRYRELIDEFKVREVLSFDKDNSKYKDFYNLISKSYGVSSFAIIPIYANNNRKHVIVLIMCFDKLKVFDAEMSDYAILQASKAAKTSYLMSKM